MVDIESRIDKIADFPKPGILFYDIAPLMRDPVVWGLALDDLKKKAELLNPDVIAGIESRGFLVGLPLAQRLNTGFIMVRKQGKLPGSTISEEYALEYHNDTLEIQSSALKPGDNVLLVDDLLATGGTAAASIKLIQKVGAKVIGCVFLIELTSLKGRAALGKLPIITLAELD